MSITRKHKKMFGGAAQNRGNDDELNDNTHFRHIFKHYFNHFNIKSGTPIENRFIYIGLHEEIISDPPKYVIFGMNNIKEQERGSIDPILFIADTDYNRLVINGFKIYIMALISNGTTDTTFFDNIFPLIWKGTETLTNEGNALQYSSHDTNAFIEDLLKKVKTPELNISGIMDSLTIKEDDDMLELHIYREFGIECIQNEGSSESSRAKVSLCVSNSKSYFKNKELLKEGIIAKNDIIFDLYKNMLMCITDHSLFTPTKINEIYSNFKYIEDIFKKKDTFYGINTSRIFNISDIFRISNIIRNRFDILSTRAFVGSPIKPYLKYPIVEEGKFTQRAKPPPEAGIRPQDLRKGEVRGSSLDRADGSNPLVDPVSSLKPVSPPLIANEPAELHLNNEVTLDSSLKPVSPPLIAKNPNEPAELHLNNELTIDSSLKPVSPPLIAEVKKKPKFAKSSGDFLEQSKTKQKEPNVQGYVTTTPLRGEEDPFFSKEPDSVKEGKSEIVIPTPQPSDIKIDDAAVARFKNPTPPAKSSFGSMLKAFSPKGAAGMTPKGGKGASGIQPTFRRQPGKPPPISSAAPTPIASHSGGGFNEP